MQRASQTSSIVSVNGPLMLVISHWHVVTDWWSTPLVHATFGYVSVRRLTRMYFVVPSHLTLWRSMRTNRHIWKPIEI
jgi:hypothetical protein